MDLDKAKEEEDDDELNKFDAIPYCANPKLRRNPRPNPLIEIQTGIAQRRIDQFENM